MKDIERFNNLKDWAISNKDTPVSIIISMFKSMEKSANNKMVASLCLEQVKQLEEFGEIKVPNVVKEVKFESVPEIKMRLHI